VCYRNNLTIIDVVTMQGQGGYGELRFSSRKPGSQKPLVFEMSDKQLKQCDSKFHYLTDVKQRDTLYRICATETILPSVLRHCWLGDRRAFGL